MGLFFSGYWHCRPFTVFAYDNISAHTTVPNAFGHFTYLKQLASAVGLRGGPPCYWTSVGHMLTFAPTCMQEFLTQFCGVYLY